MRVLITGATGFIGSHLAEQLFHKGYRIRCLVRKTSNLQWLKHLPVEYIYGDLFTEDILVEALTDVDYCYHLAGLTKAKTREEYFRANHTATRRLLEAALNTGASIRRFIHISSQAAVGPSTGEKPVDETTPFHPITTYGRSKMEAEKECLRVMDRLPVTIVRPPAVYGPRDRDVFEFFNTMNKGLHPLIGFGKKEVSLIHVSDLVDGIILAGESEQAVGQTYFISSERYYSWLEVGEVTAGVMGKKSARVRIPEWVVYCIAAVAQAGAVFSTKPALINFEKARDIVQDAWTCDIAKAKRELGFTEKMTLEDGIRQTVRWYRDQGWLT